MNKFVDHVDELQALNDDYARPGASLFVLYGRRRLGKTTLLRRFAAMKPTFVYKRECATTGCKDLALRRFTLSLLFGGF